MDEVSGRCSKIAAGAVLGSPPFELFRFDLLVGGFQANCQVWCPPPPGWLAIFDWTSPIENDRSDSR